MDGGSWFAYSSISFAKNCFDCMNDVSIEEICDVLSQTWFIQGCVW